MNVKKSAKKVFAIAAGLALVGTTVMGALAYDLSNYPAPFVEDGMAKGVIVVGENAATSDVLGAIDIAASLQAISTTGTAIAGSNAVAVEGGKDFDDRYLYNSSLSYDTKLDDLDLEGFVDSTFNFDDSDIDYEDYVSIADGAIVFEGSLSDEDFGNNIYATVPTAENINYRAVIAGDVTQVNNGTTHDDNFEFKFLGKTVRITGVAPGDATTSEITIESANEYYVEETNTLSIEGHDVVLKRVGQDAVLVSVDGQVKSINNGDTEKFDEADDFEVSVQSLFYIDGATDNSATLKLGTTISQTVKSGDSAETFGEPSDESEADWVWYVNSNTTKTTIGLDLNIDRTDIGNTDADMRNALAVGESIDLPEGYASISFESLAINKFDDISVEVKDNFKVKPDGGTQVEAWGYKVSADDQIFKVAGEDTDTLWFLKNGADFDLWYSDGTDEVDATATTATIKIDNDVHTFSASNVSVGNLTLTLSDGDTMVWYAIDGQKGFGTDPDADDANDLTATFTSGNVDGNDDYNGGYIVADYGLYFENPKDQFNSGNTFMFSMPSEAQYATVVVSSKGSTVSAGSEGGMSYSVNPIALGLGVLDTDATLGSEPMIIVGGPMANTVAADFLGNPTEAQVMETFEAGKALIKYDDANKAMLVAGWDKQETLGASYVVAKYGNYDFAGDELEVVVTDLSNIEVNAVN